MKEMKRVIATSKTILTGMLLTLLAACQVQSPATSTGSVNTATSVSQPDARLSDTWVLRQLNGRNVDTTGLGQNAPYLVLNVAEKKVQGHTGCNSLNGTFTTTGRSLHFMPMTTTRMACPGSATVETEMLGVLQAIDMFQIRNNELRLYRVNREMAVFRKVE